MLPLRPAALFRSRWAALAYAAGVLWFALDVAGTKPSDTPPPPAAPASAASGDIANDPALKALSEQVQALEQTNQTLP